MRKLRALEGAPQCRQPTLAIAVEETSRQESLRGVRLCASPASFGDVMSALTRGAARNRDRLASSTENWPVMSQRDRPASMVRNLRRPGTVQA